MRKLEIQFVLSNLRGDVEYSFQMSKSCRVDNAITTQISTVPVVTIHNCRRERHGQKLWKRLLFLTFLIAKSFARVPSIFF